MAQARKRTRIEWVPGSAALEALQIAEAVMPHLGRQEVIDKLLILGLAAMRQPALPALLGADRDAWALPTTLRLHAPSPTQVFERAPPMERAPENPGLLHIERWPAQDSHP